MATGANLSTHVAPFCAAAICVGLPPARILLARHQNTCAPTFKRLVPLQANVGRRFLQTEWEQDAVELAKSLLQTRQ